MKELRYIEVETSRKIRDQRVGAYQSPLRGAGFDFDEHQPYRPGDDVRRIDWNVTARLGVPFVRHTHAEREMNVVVVMDVSRSMALGSAARSKRESLTYISGSILFSAIADQINTGFVAFADRVLLTTPAKRTRSAAWAVLEQAWALAPAARTTLMVPVIRHLAATLKRMSVIFIVSDFVSADRVLESADLRQLAARHDVVAVVPEDRAETELPAGGGYLRARDLESGRRVSIGLGREARERYAAAVGARREALAQAFYRVPIDHAFVPTDGSPVLPVLALFARRRR
uniref:DUF58 domain-containing protein n=1 Tax=uncultured Acidobacteriota bacterium TaxID=171953 RepID=Q7X320_9BACT|nr:conserved hypothetical protein [uncultured Acidobacteriota bacterium]